MYRGAASKRVLDNGADMDSFDGSAHKRYQMGEGGSQGRAMYLRNVPRSATEIDIESLVHPFARGFPPKVYYSSIDGEWVVEFGDEDSAASAHNFLTNHPAQVKGSIVYSAYNRRDTESTVDSEKQESCKVLLATVTNLIYPVDLDLLNGLFRKHGQVEKIVTFSKSRTMFQALVQFKRPEDARDAMDLLNNRNIYDSCNTLMIQPSTFPELSVKSNSSSSRDYTCGDSDSRHHSNGSSAGVLPTPNGMNGNGHYGQQHQQSSPNHYNNHHRDQMGNYGGPPPYPGYGVQGGSLFGGDKQKMSPSIRHILPREMRDMNLDIINKSNTPVVICYHLPDLENPAQKLFNLFSLFGTVAKVKLLREKEGTALIEYTLPIYATMAFHYLQHTVINGSAIQVSFSKNKEIKMPRQVDEDRGGDDTKRAKVFGLRDQRYGGDDPMEKYMRSACKATNVLFLANVPEAMTEDELRKMFSEHGTVGKFQFKSPKEGNKSKMAAIEMGNETEALNALMSLHNFSSHSRSVKVAFSKTVMS